METKSDWRAWAQRVERVPLTPAVNRVLKDWAPLHGTVLSYLAMPDEIDLSATHGLDRCRVALTRTPNRGPLTVHEYDPSGLQRHRYGFDQPPADAPVVPLDDIDVVLVPGLAFDRSGNRLGRGKGYYDQLLASLPRGVVRVGVTVDEAVLDVIPTESHDQKVSWIATETGVRRSGVPIPDATQRFLTVALACGVAPDIHRFPAGTKTSADAAAAVGAELGEIAKSILFDIDGDPYLVIAPGDRRIDEMKLAKWAGGERARIASLATVREVTGFVAGGTPAIGLGEDTKVVADSQLARYRWVWSAGGTPDTVYPIALDRLIAASGARWAEVTDWGKM